MASLACESHLIRRMLLRVLLSASFATNLEYNFPSFFLLFVYLYTRRLVVRSDVGTASELLAARTIQDSFWTDDSRFVREP